LNLLMGVKENEMSRRRIIRCLGAIGGLTAYLREGKLFRVITGTKKNTQDRARVASQDFDWDMLARTIEEFEQRYKSQAERLGSPENRQGDSRGRKKT